MVDSLRTTCIIPVINSLLLHPYFVYEKSIKSPQERYRNLAAGMRRQLSVWACVLLASSSAQVVVQVDPSQRWGVWQGWGTSLAWWANCYGSRDDLADIFFTMNNVSYNGDAQGSSNNDNTSTVLPGLGLNIARYNLGGLFQHASTFGVAVFNAHVLLLTCPAYVTVLQREFERFSPREFHAAIAKHAVVEGHSDILGQLGQRGPK